MNLRRGLFRLWIVGTALFVLAVAFISYSEIRRAFNAIGLSQFVLLPQLCGDARGVAGKETIRLKPDSPLVLGTITQSPNFFANCWYEMSKFRPLYPEYNDVSDSELRRKLYADHGVEFHDPPSPWATVGMWAAVGFGIPLAVRALRSSLVWAFSGFAATWA